jgi:hypothetical protein
MRENRRNFIGFKSSENFSLSCRVTIRNFHLYTEYLFGLTKEGLTDLERVVPQTLVKQTVSKSSKSTKLPRIESLRMSNMSLSLVPLVRKLDFGLWH